MKERKIKKWLVKTHTGFMETCQWGDGLFPSCYIKWLKCLIDSFLDKTDGTLRSCTVKPFFGIGATVTRKSRWCLNLLFFNNPTFFIVTPKHI